MEQSSPPPIPFIRRLCRDLPQEQIEEAEQNFREYLEIVIRIYDTGRVNARAVEMNDSTEKAIDPMISADGEKAVN